MQVGMESLDRCLVLVFYVFAFTALIFEPLYYLGCDWNFDECYYEKSSSLVRMCKSVWSIYNQWDPLFAAPPDWLKVMCYIEVFIFGPLYALSAYGLQHRCNWLSYVALPFAGALFYSTIVYFAMEFIHPVPGTNLLMVFIVNIPWSIFPMLLGYRVVNLTHSKTKKDVDKKSWSIYMIFIALPTCECPLSLPHDVEWGSWLYTLVAFGCFSC